MASNEDSDFRCEPCDVTFQDGASYERHNQSSAHKAQLSNWQKTETEDTDSDEEGDFSDIMCNICHKSFSGIVPYKQHQKSAQHLKQLQSDKLTAKLMKDPNKRKGIRDPEDHDADGETALVPEVFASCLDCKKTFTGPQSYQQHIKSKKHARKVQENKFMQSVRTEEDIQNIAKALPRGIDPLVSQKLISDLKEKLTLNLSTDTDDNEEEDNYFCKECNKVFSGIIPYVQHMISETHDKKLKQCQLMKALTEQEIAEAVGSDPKHESHSPDACARRVRFTENIMSCDICHTAFSGPESAKDHLKSRGHQKKLELLQFKAELKKQGSTKSPKTEGRGEFSAKEISNTATSSSSPLRPPRFHQISQGSAISTSATKDGHAVSDEPNEDEFSKEGDEISSVDSPRKKKSGVEKVTETVKDIIEEL